MAFSINPKRNARQLPPINTSTERFPIEAYANVYGRNPLAEGLAVAGDVIAEAINRKNRIREMARQTSAIEKAAGFAPGVLEGLTSDEALAVLRETKAKGQNPRDKFITSPSGAIFDTETREFIEPPGGVKKTKPPLTNVLGLDDEGYPVYFDPEDKMIKRGGLAKNIKPSPSGYASKNKGSETERREALVSSALDSIKDIRTLLTPDVLSEIKAIRFSPLGSYSQLASPEAKRLFNNLSNAMNNETYLKSGAAVNETELKESAFRNLAAATDDPEEFLARIAIIERNVKAFTRQKEESEKNKTIQNFRQKYGY